MKTKVVYVVVGNSNNIFIEQCWCSIWSAKHYMPDCQVAVVSDTATIENIKIVKREGFIDMVDELIDSKVPDHYTNMEKSRWIKTNLRSLVRGTFLYVDTDTLFTGDISEIDVFKCSVGMVKDLHLNFCDNYFRDKVIANMLKYFDFHCKKTSNFYNGGVIFAMDTPQTHNFFNNWHSNWIRTQSKGYAFDQLSLFKTCIEHSDVVSEINGIYNCQISTSIQYLYDAKIIHFFTSNSGIHPFKNKKIYERILKEHRIATDIQEQITNCKSEFSSPSSPQYSNVGFRYSLTYQAWERLYEKKSFFFKLSERLLGLFVK